MRERLTKLGVACPRYRPVATSAEVADFAEQAGWPVVLKAVSGGYDGRGVWVCGSAADAATVLSHGVSLIAEDYVPFERELAVLIARSPSGHGAAYPVVQTVQQDGICREVLAPAPGLDPDLAMDAERLGLALARDLDVVACWPSSYFRPAPGCWLMNSPCDRITAATGQSREHGPPSSSSTCARC